MPLLMTKKKLRVKNARSGPPSKHGQNYRSYCPHCTIEQSQAHDSRAHAHPQYRIHVAVTAGQKKAGPCVNGHTWEVRQ